MNIKVGLFEIIAFGFPVAYIWIKSIQYHKNTAGHIIDFFGVIYLIFFIGFLSWLFLLFSKGSIALFLGAIESVGVRVGSFTNLYLLIIFIFLDWRVDKFLVKFKFKPIYGTNISYFMVFFNTFMAVLFTTMIFASMSLILLLLRTFF